ncbi:lipopolysaccharide biosynthesis protein [Deinococcus cavernae]|uniref:lipopolysaccharide biosynthesis protein n=1 Tax=Deinococcus cavernae TaxID=2320857 RepID=UPI001314C401|nr:lipopolysaccharide biosynthesis protein [Deinococcus cavernae]
MLILLARLSSPETVGEYSLALAVSAPLYMAANLQLRGVQATDAAARYRPGDYLVLRLLTTALAFGALLMVVQSHAPALRSVMILIGLAKAFESVSDVLYGRIQAQERMDMIGRSTLAKGPLSLLALWAGFEWGALPGVAGLLAVSWLALLLLYDLPNARRLGNAKEWRLGGFSTLWQLFVTALPLGVVMGLVSLGANLPRYSIESVLGTHALGVFSALAYLMVAFGVPVSAVGQTISPRLAHYFANRQNTAFLQLIGRVTAGVAILGLLIVLGAILVGQPVLALVYGAAYAGQAELFVWLMGAAVVSYAASILGFAMTATQRFTAQVPLFAGVTALLWLLCRLWIPEYGLIGAARAMLVANTVQLLGSAGVVALALGKRSTS